MPLKFGGNQKIAKKSKSSSSKRKNGVCMLDNLVSSYVGNLTGPDNDSLWYSVGLVMHWVNPLLAAYIIKHAATVE